jgi:hypothetical protein
MVVHVDKGDHPPAPLNGIAKLTNKKLCADRRRLLVPSSSNKKLYKFTIAQRSKVDYNRLKNKREDALTRVRARHHCVAE